MIVIVFYELTDIVSVIAGNGGYNNRGKMGNKLFWNGSEKSYT